MSDESQTLDKAVSEKVPIRELQAIINKTLENNDTGATDVVDIALGQGVFHNASDIHFEPWNNGISLRYRIDGILHEVARIPKESQPKIVARIKVIAEMVVYQKEIPQDGRIAPELTQSKQAMRVSTFPTVSGEKVVIRILGAVHDLLDLDTLGFRPELVEKLRELISRPQGMILLTGPSSSGKTTTIYSLLREIHRSQERTSNIVTIEDPVEYDLDGIAQAQVNPHTGFTFNIALRSILRQDPEVIMVGEIRDSETAKMAVQAGLTGHLVISTIHSGTAPGVFTRLLDMGTETYLVASSISGVLAQRLVRLNCMNCLEEYEPAPAIVARFCGDDTIKTFKRGAGCDQCQGIGYRGRAAVGELLLVDQEFTEQVLQHHTTMKLEEAAAAAEMFTLHESGLELVRAGRTTLEELRRVLPPITE